MKIFKIRNIILLIALSWLIGLIIFAGRIPSATINITQKYDVIIALTGGKNRIPYALELLKEGRAEQLFISGVADGFDVVAFSRDLPDELKSRIHYGDTARNTIGNASETSNWLSHKRYKKLLVVTANYHLLRTKLLFDDYLKNGNYEIDYAPVIPPDFQQNNWLNHENSLRLVLTEYHKWLLTWVKLKLNIKRNDFNDFNF
jgi:uncharacterized SAM-binding protein YcdF (DUF218 family)